MAETGSGRGRGRGRRPQLLLLAGLVAVGCGGGVEGDPPAEEASAGAPGASAGGIPESPAAATTKSSPLTAAFQTEGAVGTLLIRRLGDGLEWVHAPARADSALLPASTFKIANAAIALETGVVTGPDELFPWDGTQRDLPAWNRDLTLTEAMAASAVPVYQEVARRVGAERMADWLQRLDYGNADIGGGVDRFWLDGGLRISAREQVTFLERLATGDLPLSPHTMEQVAAMIRLDGGDGWALHGKTGWASVADLGWWVGWTVHGDEQYVFALNMVMGRMEDAPKRISIARQALVAVGALPAQGGG